MAIVTELNEVLEHLLAPHDAPNIEHTDILKCIDLTLLDKEAIDARYLDLQSKANLYPVAALCIYPKKLQLIQNIATAFKATVVNFPFGNSSVTHCYQEIDQALDYGAQEIDYVIPYAKYLEGEKSYTLKHAEQVIAYCKKHQLKSKIIIESGSFANIEQIYELSFALAKLQCDFIKTSTGTTSQGASLSAAFAIAIAIKDADTATGIKLSGGIKTTKQAYDYAQLMQIIFGKKIHPDWFRIGASSLLDALIY